MIQTFEHLWVLNFDPLKTKTLVKFHDVMIILNQFLKFLKLPIIVFYRFLLTVGGSGRGGVQILSFNRILS